MTTTADDPTFSDAHELLAYQRETDRLAQENLALSHTNFANLVPWRWLRFFKTHRQIQANLREVRRRLAVGERGYQKIFGQMEKDLKEAEARISNGSRRASS